MSKSTEITVAVQADMLPMLIAQRDALRVIGEAYFAASGALTTRIREKGGE